MGPAAIHDTLLQLKNKHLASNIFVYRAETTLWYYLKNNIMFDCDNPWKTFCILFYVFAGILENHLYILQTELYNRINNSLPSYEKQ